MRLLLLVVLLLFASLALAFPTVPSDTIRIQEVSVSSNKNHSEKSAFRFDSTRLKQAEMLTLSKFLQENSSIQFKTYGTSGSSVMSIRGANSSQSKVIWNGMTLGSPMLNMNDVSLLSVANAEQIELYRGGASASEGNGALAGYISMKSPKAYNKEQISIGLDYNLLNNQTSLFNYTKGNNKFASSTSIQWLNHQNKFKYANFSELGNPVQEQVNSQWNQVAIIQSFYYRSKSAELEWHNWYQESDRALSPPMYNRMRTSYQMDKSIRSIFSLKKTLKEQLTLHSNVSFTREILRYVSRVQVNKQNLELFNTKSYFDQLQHQSTLQYSHKNFSQQVLYQFYFDGAYVEDYAQYQKRYRLAFASISKYNWKNRASIYFANRVEILKKQHYFASSLTFTIHQWNTLGLQPYIRVSQNYNLPGLNDMYWTPGGNPNLIAERSFEQEVGTSYQKQVHQFYFKTNISAYHSMVNDWILWQPSAIENGVWTPQNLVEVKLQGLEFDQEIKYQIQSDQLLSTKLFYAKTLALNNKAVNANDQTVGKQIIYIPEEKWGVTLSYRIKETILSSNMHRVSHRYTSADHSDFLKGYHLVDLRVQHTFKYKKSQYVTALYVDNITNTLYESIPFQAMPARVFGINFKYQFNQH